MSQASDTEQLGVAKRKYRNFRHQAASSDDNSAAISGNRRKSSGGEAKEKSTNPAQPSKLDIESIGNRDLPSREILAESSKCTY